MALMDFLCKQSIDVIERPDATADTLMCRFPMQGQEIQTGAPTVKLLTAFLGILAAVLLSACDSEDGKRAELARQTAKAKSLQDTFTKPIVRIPVASASKQNAFGIKDCHVYRAVLEGGAITEWKLLFKPAPYLLPTMCVRERLEMDGDYLTIEIGTQAIGAGGCCTTYAAYRTRNGKIWEMRPATSIQTWQPLEDQRKSNDSAADQVAYFTEKFVSRLAQRKSVADLLRPKFDFVFHEDNRCDGNTDGQILNMPALRLDSAFELQVTNDGDAWGCDKEPPSTRTMTFDLNKMLSKWDRFEVEPDGDSSNIFFVQGRGVSDYLVVHLEKTDNRLVVSRIEYRSEDPG